MKIHIRQVPPQGLTLSGEESPEIFDLKETLFRFEQPVCHELLAQMESQGLLVTGRLWTTVRCECCRCLKPLEIKIEVPDFTVLKPITSECVDLTDDFREDIVLNLPFFPKCETAGQPPCQPAGQKQEPLTGDPNADHPHGFQGEQAWNALDKLNINPQQRL